MQPTFLPWIGYFSLIAQADDFVFLDDVQFSKQSWQSRNRILGPNGPVMLTLPVARKPSFPRICDAQLGQPGFDRKLLARIKGCLGTAPHWAEVETLLDKGLARAPLGLASLNIGLIRDIGTALELETQFHKSSDLGLPECDRSARLLQICQALSDDVYLSPVGSAGYLRESNPFSEETVRLRFLNFTHPEYRQKNWPFQSHMSIIDALAWVGAENTRKMIMDGIGAALPLSDLPADQAEVED